MRACLSLRMFVVVGLCGLSLALACGSADGQTAKDEKTKQELIDIERRIGAANLNCDYKYFAMIEAVEFIFTDSNGGVTSREQDLAGEADCKKSTSSYDVDDAKVWLNGSTAVVTGRITIQKPGQDVAAASRSRFTDVFVFRDRRWQLVAGHSSRIREAQKAS
jgi:Domain of unknown function (DUF4440)